MTNALHLGFFLAVSFPIRVFGWIFKNWKKSGGCIDAHYDAGDVDLVKYNWWYNWGTSIDPLQRLENSRASFAEFVPMVWGRSELDTVSEKLPEDARTILGFNEPNMHKQSNMTPSEACSAWPVLEAAAEKRQATLVSPAVNHCFNIHRGRCEVWIRPQGIKSSAAKPGHTCLRYKASKYAAGGHTLRSTMNNIWEAVDGGVGRACRGSTPTDNEAKYYTVHLQRGSNPAALLEGCKARCKHTPRCHGIEHSSTWNGCTMSPWKWLKEFFQHCPNARVDAIATHAYGCSADHVEAFVKQLSHTFKRPVWLTEFGCPSTKKRAFEFMRYILPRLEALSNTTLARYSWFIQRVGVKSHLANMALVTNVSGSEKSSKSVRTALGELYSTKSLQAAKRIEEERARLAAEKVAKDRSPDKSGMKQKEENEKKKLQQKRHEAVAGAHSVALASLATAALTLAAGLTLTRLLIRMMATRSDVNVCIGDDSARLRLTGGPNGSEGDEVSKDFGVDAEEAEYGL
eukprot:TRINITY_DN90595_c0_g1_i1.p1 TRINITY_DN90595_c0_g1~~TRINITY_DN90595_c0_g1_i1.p1  ORF type:complete len:515 (+),score=85.05 TRINITY_DN90595_c0_g1_i1:61-1605(+)